MLQVRAPTFAGLRAIRNPELSWTRIKSSVHASSQQSRKKALVIYTKDECPLCDGLKDKISGILARARFTGSQISCFGLEIRDISGNSEWLSKYSMEVPVLAVRSEEGVEVWNSPGLDFMDR